MKCVERNDITETSKLLGEDAQSETGRTSLSAFSQGPAVTSSALATLNK